MCHFDGPSRREVFGILAGQGQPKVEGRSAIEFRIDAHASPIIIDESLHQRQPDAVPPRVWWSGTA